MCRVEVLLLRFHACPLQRLCVVLPGNLCLHYHSQPTCCITIQKETFYKTRKIRLVPFLTYVFFFLLSFFFVPALVFVNKSNNWNLYISLLSPSHKQNKHTFTMSNCSPMQWTQLTQIKVINIFLHHETGVEEL